MTAPRVPTDIQHIIQALKALPHGSKRSRQSQWRCDLLRHSAKNLCGRCLVAKLWRTKNVDDFVTAKASNFNRVQQSSTSGLQRFQQESLRNHKFQQSSTGFGIWFGTRGSVVPHTPLASSLLHACCWCRFGLCF